MQLMGFLKETSPKFHFALSFIGLALFSSMLPVGFIAGALWAGINCGFKMGQDS